MTTQNYLADLEKNHKLRKYTLIRLDREKEQSLMRETLKNPSASMTMSQSMKYPWLPLTRAQDRSGTLSFAFHPHQDAAEKLPASALPSSAGNSHGSQCSTSSGTLSKASQRRQANTGDSMIMYSTTASQKTRRPDGRRGADQASSDSSLALQPRAQTAPHTNRCQQRARSRLGSLVKSFDSLELVGGEWRRKRPTTKNAMYKGGGEAWFTLTL
eukprot:TRINITY_DN6445_c0_g1_i1.p1 TRINITY_DN6445_c0_g1~~TRINITY_DN6445_c0_g1_i1.p1  ORF type:complete len:214 (+),score=28.31 TRINITY_DN6445_c0_g1_i1:50-691(+)